MSSRRITKKNVLISIGMPTFNRKEYVKEAVESVLNQSFKNFELIIVDDCSTDGTWEYLLGLEDQRIKLFRNKENLGLVSNWRQCLKHAKGKWFKFLMADDIFFSKCLEEIVKVLPTDDSSCVVLSDGISFNEPDFFDTFRQNEGGKKSGTPAQWKKLNKVFELEKRKRFYFDNSNPSTFTAKTTSFMAIFNSGEYKNIEKLFNSTGHCVDYFILTSLIIHSKDLVSINLPLYGIRIHSSNASNNTQNDYLYHVKGDKFINYQLFDYHKLQNIHIYRHALYLYLFKIKANNSMRIMISFSIDLIIFILEVSYQILFKLNPAPTWTTNHRVE